MDSLEANNDFLPGDDEEVREYLELRAARRNRIKNLKFDSDSDSEDELGNNSDYKIIEKTPTLEEKEEEEEIELSNTINNLNMEYRRQRQIYSSSEENSEASESGEENAQNISPTISTKKHDSFTSEHTLSTLANTYLDESTSTLRFTSFLNQNLKIYDELMKIIVIGNKKVGKSFFIQKLLDESKPDDLYQTTSCLEIRKTMINVNNRKVKLELFDTNCQIQNSGIIKTYYKLSHGFVAIIDSLMNVESLLFAKMQIETIHQVASHAKVFFIINEDPKKVHESIPQSNLKIIHELKENYLVTIKHCDINKIDLLSDTDFISYIKEILTNKKPSSNDLKKWRRKSESIHEINQFLKTSPVFSEKEVVHLSPKEEKIQKIVI